MTPEQFERARELFEQALSLPRTEQEAFLVERCAGMPELHAVVCNLLERALAQAAQPAADSATPSPGLLGFQIGPYRIRSVLGEGGMGTVYEAEHERTHQVVALKLIRPGLATPSLLRRFEYELQTLARLEHAGIARIYHADTANTGSGPQPYFAMELVRGQNLLEYAKQHALTIRQRLELGARIADAVQYAHQQGVIHRDLKPGNIFVTAEGQPKILDFGVARATDSDVQSTTLQAEIGQLIGTLPYMSPEQASGDPNRIDTRSDVYALGVVIYELLTGRLPYLLQQRMIHDVLRIIRDEEPTRLSSLNRTLRGDVETIIGKALEKDKDRRYASANALAADIRRHLNDEPIAARPPSAVYQIGKFARRNKVLVGGVAATLLVLAAATAISSTFYFRSRRAAFMAAQEAAKAQATLGVLEHALQSQSFGDLGRGVRLKHVLAAARTAAREMRESNPEVASRTLSLLCETELAYGDRKQAEADIREAIQLLNRIGRGDTRESASAQSKLAAVLIEDGRHAVARPLAERSVAILRAAMPATRLELAEALNVLSQIDFESGHITNAETASREALAVADSSSSELIFQQAAAHAGIGAVRWRQSKLQDAEAELRRSFVLFEASAGPFHGDTLKVQHNLAYILHAAGRPDDANRLFDDGIRRARAQFGNSHPVLARILNRSGLCSWHNHDWGRACSQLDEAVAIAEREFGDDSLLTAEFRVALALCEQDSPRSIVLLRSAVPILRKESGDGAGSTQAAMGNLAVKLAHSDDSGRAEAELLLRDLRAVLRQNAPASEVTLDDVCYWLGFVVSERMRLEGMPADEQAELVVRDGYAVAVRQGDSFRRDMMKLRLANVLGQRGKIEEAARLCEEVWSEIVSHPGNFHLQAFALHTRVLLLIRESRLDEADVLLTELECEIDARPHDPDRVPNELFIRMRIEYWSALHELHPDRSYDAIAFEWRDKLVEWRASARPSAQSAPVPATSAP